MNLATAFNLLNSSFASNAAQTSVISRNIANVNTPGYVREVANVVTNAFGGADIGSITRQTNGALLDQMLDSTSQSASSRVISDGVAALSQTVNDSATASSVDGASENGRSPSAMLANLQSAIQTYAGSPSNASVGQAVVTAATDLVNSLHDASATVQLVRSQADTAMGASVTKINALLGQYQQADASVVIGLQSGADVSVHQDTRDHILTQLSQEIGVSTITNPNGSLSIYTDSGVPLFQTTASVLSFKATPTLVGGASGNTVSVNGVAITGASAPMAVRTGALAGYASLRDTVAPQYQAQLDQIAGGLINAFAEDDQSGTATQPSLPGLFTYSGATGLPSPGAMGGLAIAIEVNANVDPARGGNVNLLRDGGIAAPGNSAYVYNPTGAAGFTDRILQLASQMTSTQSFDPAAGLGAAGSLGGYANASVSWLQSLHQQTTDKASYEDAVATQAAAALSNATGVSLDVEMTNMLNLENTYSTTAKLLTTINAMFDALMKSI